MHCGETSNRLVSHCPVLMLRPKVAAVCNGAGKCNTGWYGGCLFCSVPLEIRVFGEKEPIYDFNLEDLGRFNEQPVLPFNAYGTLAWARAESDNNSASSQIFFLLKESELTPSGANLLDGRYAVFGYVVQGQEDLGSMKVRA